MKKKKNRKITYFKLMIAVITLNVNGLSVKTPIKRYCQTGKIKARSKIHTTYKKCTLI